MHYTNIEQELINFIIESPAADSAHDISHIERVVNMAKKLALSESANLDIVVPAAWLHDCVAVAKDSPLRSKASSLAADKAAEILSSLNYPQHLIEPIKHAIAAHSYSAAITPTTLEAKIIQDADRMDALGAIGVARCMLVGGAIGRTLYHRQDPTAKHREPDDKMYTIDHFYTKLLHIGQTMQTESARDEASRRTHYMKSFIDQLHSDILAEELAFETTPKTTAN